MVKISKEESSNTKFKRKSSCISEKFILYLFGIKSRCQAVFKEVRERMRVIAGSARRLLLKTIEGLDTRPTTDRIKETLFNMLQPDIPDCLFLDLFSGSGAIGIEALSRGASLAVMIENNPKALECIRENLARTHLEDNAMVMGCDVMTDLKRLEGRNYRFDLIFMDPPYGHGHERAVLEYLSHSPMATEDTLAVVEASKDTEFDWLMEAGWYVVKTKEYKTNKHVFVKKESR